MRVINYNLAKGDAVLVDDLQAQGRTIDFQFSYSGITGSPVIEVYMKTDQAMPYMLVDSLLIDSSKESDCIRIANAGFEYFSFRLVANGGKGTIETINVLK